MQVNNTHYLILENTSRLQQGYYDTPDLKQFISDKHPEIIVSDDTYKGYLNNAHHFTTKFHREVLLPKLAEMLNFEIDWSKYKVVERYAYVDEDKFDISFLKPIHDGVWHIYDFFTNVGYDGPYKFLQFNLITEYLLTCGYFKPIHELNQTSLSDYHKLYAFPHTDSMIINQNPDNNGRKLLISGDSQIIPSITFLATIFKEVWILDNRRTDVYSIAKILKNAKFDDVLYEIGGYSIHNIKLDQYFEKNFH